MNAPQQNAGPAAVRAKGLSKTFRDFWGRPRVRALAGIDLEIAPGEVFGLLGPNGSGKSTTLKLLLGLLRPTGGIVEVLGGSPRDVKTRARIGYLPETSCLYGYLTSQETMEFYARLFDLSGPVRRERIEQLFAMIGLRHARKRLVGEFSKGMARRIGLAQALVNDPDLVILDEPTSGLDPIGCRQVKDLILQLGRRGKTVILASHLLADVADVCHRVAILYNGAVCALGAVRELLEVPDSWRMTVPAADAEGIRRAAESVARETGVQPLVERPSQTLEQFFVSVVEQEQRRIAESTGVAKSDGVATFLAAEPAPAPGVLERLVDRSDSA